MSFRIGLYDRRLKCAACRAATQHVLVGHDPKKDWRESVNQKTPPRTSRYDPVVDMRECWPGWRERKTRRHGVEVIRPGEKLILIDTDHFNENPGLYLAHAIAHLDLHLKLLPAWFCAQQCEDADFHATTRLDSEEDRPE